MSYEFRLPDVGEGIAEAEIVRWLVQEGDPVRLDQPLVEIETDKAVVEVPAPVAGIVIRRGGREGETLHVGDLLAVLDADGAPAGAQPAGPRVAASARASGIADAAVNDGRLQSQAPARRPLATPAVRKLARDLGVDLTGVRASGAEGRITAEDVQTAAEQRRTGAVAVAPAEEETAAPSASPAPARPATAPVAAAEDERVPLHGLRRRIAESMTQSWRTIPHITGLDEVDVSELVALRKRLRVRLEEQGVHLSYLPFIVKAVVAALRQHPIVNSSLDEAAGEIVHHHRYNIGIATATPEGLIVPVLHDADRKALRDIAAEIYRLSEQARSRTVELPALQGGTFTITNFGSLGGWLGTPIIRPGEAAILGVGRIQDRPWVVEGRLEVRPVMALSFSADHRLIDGDVSTAFMRTVTGYLSDPLTLFVEMA